MTSDPRSGEPVSPPAAPDDVTAAWAAPTTPSPATPSTPTPAPSAAPFPAAGATPPAPGPMWSSPVEPGRTADPFGRPLDPPEGRAATGPVEAPPVRARGNGGMLVNVLLGIALVVAVGGVAFAVGRATAPVAAATTNRGGFGGTGAFGPNASGAPGGTFNGGFGAGGVSIQGTVTAVSADSITLQLASGQTVTIPLNAQTTYHERSAATAAAVTSGSTVIVQLEGGRGAFGNGNGGQGVGPNASGAPGRALGTATTVTVVPSGS